MKLNGGSFVTKGFFQQICLLDLCVERHLLNISWDESLVAAATAAAEAAAAAAVTSISHVLLFKIARIAEGCRGVNSSA